MKRYNRSIRLVLFLLLVSTIPAAVAAQSIWDRTQITSPPLGEIQLPEVERVELANGMILYLLEDGDFPVVQGSMLLRAGSTLDPDDKVGLARMTGTVLRTGGSAAHPGDDLDQFLEGIGASVEFNVGQTNGSGGFWSLKENASEVMAIFADLLRNPAFPEEKLDLAKVSLRQQIASRNDEAMDILQREMGKLIHGSDHPYARHTEYATVEAVTREDLVAFHEQVFHPDRIYLTIWGDIDAKKIKADVERLFADWKPSGEPAPGLPPVAAIVEGGGLAYAEKKGTTNTWVVMGHVGLKGDHPDYAAMNVLGEILGGGFSSRLFNEIRTKRGLAYAAGSSPGTSIPRAGVFIGYAGTRSDSALVALDLLGKEIRKVTVEPVTAEELKNAKDAILNRYVFQYASKGQIANRMAFLDFYGYPVDFTSRYPEQVKVLTAQDLLEAAKRNIHPDDLQVLVVGDEGDFAEPLSSLGSEYVTVDLTIPDPPESEEIPEASPASLEEGKRLLTKAIEATGGIDGWKSLEDITEEIDLSASVQGMNLSIAIHSIHSFDGRDFVSQVLPFGEMVMVRTGETGWKKGPQGVEDMSPAEIDELRRERARDFSEIFRNVDAVQAQALSKSEIQEMEADRILLNGPGFEKLFLYLDPATGEPIARRYQGKAPMTGAPVQTTELLSDYRQVGPVRMPYAFEILHDGEHFASGIVKSIVINAGVDESKFAKP